MKSVELADLFAVTLSTISRWEHEDQPINRLAWALLAQSVIEGAPPAVLSRIAHPTRAA